MADDDECFEIEDLCSADEECVNMPGGYSCECKKGYFKKEGVCLKGMSLKKEPMICIQNSSQHIRRLRF